VKINKAHQINKNTKRCKAFSFCLLAISKAVINIITPETMKKNPSSVINTKAKS
jgi:hypothetical protein